MSGPGNLTYTPSAGAGASSGRPAPPRRPYGIACLGCRRVKMRCIIVDNEAKCERCTRLRKDCVFEAHKRGLWKRDRRPTVEQPPAPTTGTGFTNQQTGGQASFPNFIPSNTGAGATERRTNSIAFPEVAAIRGGDRQHTFDAPRPPDFGATGTSGASSRPSPATQRSNSTTFLPHSSASPGTTGSASQSPGREEKIRFNVASFVPTDVDAGELAVDVALDTQRRIMEGDNSAKSLTSSDDREKSWQELDPIHMKLLNRPAAEVLFDAFMKHFNSLAAYLDPMLYTFTYTREASNLLFTACLSIAATVFRPELYRSLKQHQEMLLGKALLACDASVEVVWTMCLLSYWKDVGDRRGYNLVGFAIQLAKSAEWNKTRRPRSLSQVEKLVPTQRQMEVHVRQRRDKHLAWLLLGALDRTTSMFTNRPLTNPPLTDVSTSRSWIGSEPESYIWGCTRHVAGYELTAITRPVFEFVLRTGADNDDTQDDAEDLQASERLREFQELMRTFNSTMDAWKAYWIPVFTRVSPCQQQSQVTFYGEYMKLYFNSILLHRILVDNDDDVDDPAAVQALNTCYSSSMAVLKEAREFGRLDLLYYFWDSAHLTSAYAAMMLLKVLNLSSALPENAAADALEVLTGLLAAYTNTAQAMAWRPPASDKQPMAVDSDKIPVANALEAQARLLRSIVGTINARFVVPTARDDNNAASSSYFGGSMMSAPTPPPWAQMQPELYSGDSAVDLNSGVSGGGAEEPQQFQQQEPDTDMSSFAMNQLVGDMDFSLDSSFMDTRFTEAGLLGWDEMGIFAVDK